jgi:hypothetical protein
MIRKIDKVRTITRLECAPYEAPILASTPKVFPMVLPTVVVASDVFVLTDRSR